MPTIEMASPHLQLTLESVKDARNLQEDVLVDGNNLNLAKVVAVEKGGSKVKISKGAWDDMQANADYLEEKIRNGLVVYGINTGFGGSADVRSWEIEEMQRTLIRHSKVGMATYFPNEVVRGAMVVRANCNAKAYSGIRPEVIQRVVDLINLDIVPRVPERGSISASGDLNPLSYIAACMVGQEDAYVRTKGETITAAEALRRNGLPPLTLVAKEGLALINSDSFSAGVAAPVVYDANVAALLVQVTTAMTAEGLRSRTEYFDPTRPTPHAGQKEVVRNISRILKGSRMAISADMKDKDWTDRYAIQSAPQWLSPVLETLEDAIRRIHVELNAANDNPIIDHRTDTVAHGANFQGMTMSVAMDQTRQALNLCGKLVFGLIQELINGKLNFNLPPNLSGCDINVDFGFKGVDIASAAYMSELDHTSNLMSNHMVCAETHNQSVNSLALVSSRKTNDALHILRLMLSNHLFAAAQAIDLRWLQIRVLKSLDDMIGQFPKLKVAMLKLKWWDFVFLSEETAEIAAKFLPENQRDDFKTRIIDDMKQQLARVTYDNVSEDLGEGTRKMYQFLRKGLSVPFYTGRIGLDEHLEKIFASIKSRAIEEPLLDIFGDLVS